MPLHGHLILVNLGTPTAPTPEAVREFLDEFLSDPAVVDYPGWFWKPFLRRIILPKRPIPVAHAYQSIWTTAGSPLRVATDRYAAVVGAAAPGLAVHTAYRYGEPSLESVMGRVAMQDPDRVIVVPLFPQRTNPTTGTIFNRAREAASRAGIADRVSERLVAPDDAGYVAAMADRWREGTKERRPEHLVVSFHGIPKRFNRQEHGVYVRDCEVTTRALLHAIDWPAARTTLAYQSKFGPEPWLAPATADVLVQLPRRGVTSVAVITPGFVTEGLETIEEIGIRGREAFGAAGGTHFIRVGGVEDHPAFVASLVRLAAQE